MIRKKKHNCIVQYVIQIHKEKNAHEREYLLNYIFRRLVPIWSCIVRSLFHNLGDKKQMFFTIS